jgi:hypothetical protein
MTLEADKSGFDAALHQALLGLDIPSPEQFKVVLSIIVSTIAAQPGSKDHKYLMTYTHLKGDTTAEPGWLSFQSPHFVPHTNTEKTSHLFGLQSLRMISQDKG